MAADGQLVPSDLPPPLGGAPDLMQIGLKMLQGLGRNG